MIRVGPHLARAHEAENCISDGRGGTSRYSAGTPSRVNPPWPMKAKTQILSIAAASKRMPLPGTPAMGCKENDSPLPPPFFVAVYANAATQPVLSRDAVESEAPPCRDGKRDMGDHTPSHPAPERALVRGIWIMASLWAATRWMPRRARGAGRGGHVHRHCAGRHIPRLSAPWR